MRGLDVEPELVDEAAQARNLTLWDLEDEPGQRARVDDRVLERALQAAADEPGVEGVVAVFHEHSALREAEECASRVLEDRRADQHRAVDVVTPARVRVDGRAAIDKRVEEGQRAVQAKSLSPQLEHEKRRVARGLDVEGHELRFVQRRLRAHFGRVDSDLLPGHRGGRATGLEVQGLRAHRAAINARRAQLTSWVLTARSRSTATTYTAAPATIGTMTMNPSRPLSG